ncbi:MAG: asparaginase [Ramlibacter sp.]
MTAERIVVLGTGGTIAGAADTPQDHVGYRAGQVPVARLLERIPALAGLRVETEQVAQIDSKDMEPAVWLALAQRCRHWLAQPDVAGVVVTHGTDTLEETAYALSRLLPGDRPVVLTCAMRPATALSADGPQNIVDAVTVVRTEGARGITAVCSGKLHAAADVRKVHPYRLDAFSSGDAGPLGFVEDGRLHLVRSWPEAAADAQPPASPQDGETWPWVEIVHSHAGADGRLVRALVRDGVRGLVVAATGNGTVHHRLEEALLAAMAQGVRVVRASRCPEGRLLVSGEPSLPAHPLTPAKARIDLMLELAAR